MNVLHHLVIFIRLILKLRIWILIVPYIIFSPIFSIRAPFSLYSHERAKKSGRRPVISRDSALLRAMIRATVKSHKSKWSLLHFRQISYDSVKRQIQMIGFSKFLGPIIWCRLYGVPQLSTPTTFSSCILVPMNFMCNPTGVRLRKGGGGILQIRFKSFLFNDPAHTVCWTSRWENITG